MLEGQPNSVVAQSYQLFLDMPIMFLKPIATTITYDAAVNGIPANVEEYSMWCDEEANTKEDAITSSKRTIGELPRARGSTFVSSS